MTTTTEAPREAVPEPLKVVAWLTVWEKDRIRGAGSHLQRHEPMPKWPDNSYEPLVRLADAQSALESERQAHAAEVERLRGDAERMPAEMATRIQVSFCPGAWDTFIYGVSGHLTMEALTAIDASIRDEDSGSLFDKGTGDYLLSAHYFKGQYGFDGRCEIAPGWELSVISFTPLDAAIDQAIARGTK